MPSSKAKKSGSKPGAKHRRIKAWKIVLLLLLLPTVAAAAFLIRCYYLFDAAIEEKMQRREVMAETRIFAAPTVLTPGRRMSCSELETRIRRLGYENGARDPEICHYRVLGPNHLLIHNGASVPDAANRSADIVCAGDAIRSMTDPSSGSALREFPLKPELLSNAIEGNREKRRPVSYAEIPDVLVKAVLAAEDRRFFSHGGIDPIRIVKALFLGIREGEVTQGASTLTQQFAKNYFLTPERTWKRKFSDAFMSILLERRLSKEEIFELYSNEVYLGQAGSFSIVGFGKAADVFFNKSIRDLTLDEAAVLAGMITAPNRNTPLRYRERALARRNLVLDLMAEYGMITPGERDAAKARPLRVEPASILNYSDAPYFVDYVQERLEAVFRDAGPARFKLQVYTSLDMDLQKAAFESMQKGLADLDAYFSKRTPPVPPGTIQASLIAVDPKNGRILAMIGGRNYGVSQFNRITQSRRQPGSIFKPIVYAAALETAYNSPAPWTAASILLDKPTEFTFDDLEYAPKNYGEEYMGQVTVRQAISKSLNIATIKLAEKVGYDKVVELARRLGLNEMIKAYPAMAIGSFEITPLEMVRAYTAFANEGLLSDLTPIVKIYDGDGNPVYLPQPKTTQVLTPQVAFLVTSLLESVVNSGTGAGVRARGFQLPAAGKTGTSHDGWFAGYTPELLCIVWVGFDDNRELNRSGSQAALPIWTEFMKKAVSLRPLKGEGFRVPEEVIQVEIDPSTGLLATERCLQRQMEYFIQGTEPGIYCYGNNYEQAEGSGGFRSIYSSPSKEARSEADNNKEPRD